MTVTEEIERVLRAISDRLAVIDDRLAAMQDVLNRIALGLGVRPDE